MFLDLKTFISFLALLLLTACRQPPHDSISNTDAEIGNLELQIEFKLSGDRNAYRKVQEEARRIFGELEKRERNNKRSGRSNSLNNLKPTIVPVQ